MALLAIFGSSLALEAATIEHPNELKFKGVLVRLDEPSTKAPNGARGHRIMIPKSVAEKRLKTLLNMGVNYSDDLEKHNASKKVGVIKKAWIEGNAIHVSGVIWKKDFPDAEKIFKNKNLGMSFEAANISVEDMSAGVWKLSDLCFTGAAILYKGSAAYFKTEALAASADGLSIKLIKTNDGGNSMANKQKGNTKKTSVAASGATTNEALVIAFTKAQEPLVNAINNLAASQNRLEASFMTSAAESIVAKGKKAAKPADDEGDEGDDDEDDIDSESDEDEKHVDAAGDDDEDEDLESSSDDEDEIEDLDEDEADEQQTPGKMNKDIEKKKGDKTTVTTQKDKHKTVETGVKASASTKVLEQISAQMDEVVEANNAYRRENKKLSKKVAAMEEQIEAAATKTDRRSYASPMLAGLLHKEGIDVSTIQASDEKMDTADFDAILDKGNLSTTQRIALKTEAARTGTIN